MLQVGATAPAPPPTTSSAGIEGTSHQKLHKKKKFHVLSVSTYEGKCEEIKHHAYNIVPGKNEFDVFAKTTTTIGEYIVWTVPNTGEFMLIMRPEKSGFPVIPVPPLPAVRNDLIKLEVWHIANKQYNRPKNKWSAYTIVWGQCSPTVQYHMKASPTYQQVCTDLDLIKIAATDSDIDVHQGDLQRHHADRQKNLVKILTRKQQTVKQETENLCKQ
jgi:hypothetical protein